MTIWHEHQRFNYREGQQVLFTSGDVPDGYQVILLVEILKYCCLKTIGKKFVKAAHDRPPPDHEDKSAWPEDFPKWLVDNGYAKVIDIPVVHCGQYSEFELGIDDCIL